MRSKEKEKEDPRLLMGYPESESPLLLGGKMSRPAGREEKGHKRKGETM